MAGDVCLNQIIIIDLDNGFSPIQHQAINWISADLFALNPWEQTYIIIQKCLENEARLMSVIL